MANLTPELWELSVNDSGHLVVGGADMVGLAAEYGTPVYVVHEKRLRENFFRILDAFKSRYPSVEIYYSYKTNCIPGVLEVLHEIGAKAEVISGYELWLAQRLGVPPESIILNGPNKTEEELTSAVRSGIRLINVDSLDEIERIDKICSDLGMRANIGIRVCPGVTPKGMSVLTATGSRNSHFGVDLKTGEAFEAYRKASVSDHLNLIGMHCHIGSGAKDPHAYAAAARMLLKLAGEVKSALGKDLQYLDLGGGIGTPGHHDFSTLDTFMHLGMNRMPKPPNPASCPSIETFAELITTSIRSSCDEFGVDEPTLILEPGRYITGDCQTLLLGVGTLKNRPGVAKFAITDGGMLSTSLMPVAEYHKVFVANKMNIPTRERYRMYGRVCTTADFLYKGIELPTLQEGDTLAVMDAGAYFVGTGTNFAYPRAPIVMVKDGESWPLRSRESFEDLVRNDIISATPAKEESE